MVDDDQELCELTAKVLMREGYEVKFFHNAGEAIAHARDERPDLILMDMMMPEMSGEDAIKMIKSDPTLQSIPILCLTGLLAGGDPDVGETSINIKGNHYPALGKPFDKAQLIESIQYYSRR